MHKYTTTGAVGTPITVNVIPENHPPQLTGLEPTVTFLESAVVTPQLLDTNVTVSDPENNFSGGALRVTGVLPEDIISIPQPGNWPRANRVFGKHSNFCRHHDRDGHRRQRHGVLGRIPCQRRRRRGRGIDREPDLPEHVGHADAEPHPCGQRGDSSGALSNFDFTEQVGAANPFDGLFSPINGDPAAPFLVDLDGDGDLDAVVGDRHIVHYLENTGTTAAPVFIERTGAANPFGFINYSSTNSSASPALVDLDADGDFDAVVAESQGVMHFYENTGTALAPVFGEGFTGIDVGLGSDPALVDLDGDGDLDAIVGNRDGNFRYFLNIAGPASNPLFTEQTGAANPFNGVDVGDRATSTFADLTGDGVIDVITGARDGTLRFYLNTGTASAPVLTQQAGAANPFNGIDLGQASTPELADVDGDGDLDAVIGSFTPGFSSSGVLHYFENTGTTSAPVFVERTGAANPFNSFVGLRNPVLADVDGDGDLDAAVGTGPTQRVRYFENTGTTSAPVYVERTGAANPFDAVVERDARFDLADADGDGDLDAVVGDREGNINYFINVGTATTPMFTAANPLLNIGGDARPAFADLDDDGDFDLAVGQSNGTLRYFLNVGTSSEAGYVEQTGATNPFGGISVGQASAPTFIDLDGDGDFDLVVGENDGVLNYFENVGTVSSPVFTFFAAFNVGRAIDPAVADLDGDGDFDVMVGGQNGVFRYFMNTGGVGTPAFVEQTGVANPLNGVSVGVRSTSAFADIDGDGLLDAVIGSRDGTLRVFLNTGTVSVPVLSEQIGASNPFNGVDVGQASTPELADVDGDGDLDAVIGGFNPSFGPESGSLHYFENTGTTTTPVYVERTGAANPFVGIVGVRNPVLADLDGDGDLDAAVGGPRDGTIHYYENTGTSTAPVYVERTGVANPFNGLIERDARFSLADFDGDGDLDVVVGTDQNTVDYYENIGTPSTPYFLG